MEDALRVLYKLIEIISRQSSFVIADDNKILFRNLLNDLLGMCSDLTEIPDFLAVLTYLISITREGSNVRHKDEGDIYVFHSFSTRTSKNNKGTDVIYHREMAYPHNKYFTKSLKDFCISFEVSNSFVIEIINTALKAEKICYSGKGFMRDDNKESLMLLFYLEGIGKK